MDVISHTEEEIEEDNDFQKCVSAYLYGDEQFNDEYHNQFCVQFTDIADQLFALKLDTYQCEVQKYTMKKGINVPDMVDLLCVLHLLCLQGPSSTIELGNNCFQLEVLRTIISESDWLEMALIVKCGLLRRGGSVVYLSPMFRYYGDLYPLDLSKTTKIT